MNKHLHNSLRALFLSLAVLLSLPMLAIEVMIDGINYDLNAETKQATVVSKSDKYSGEVVIPESVEHEGTAYSVKSIGNYAFSGCSGLTSVTIPNSVTNIGGGAFEGCKGLTSVTIPNSVTSIGERAFEGCKGLTSVTIPNSVTSIGDGAFYWCSGLTSVSIGNSVTSIGNQAFAYCSGLTSVTIGNSVTSIGESAFRDCSGLTSVTIPNSVTSIGEGVFSGCSGLTSVTIGNSVKSIGKSAFMYCTRLTSVHISDIAAWCNIEFGDIHSNPLYNAHHLYLNGEEVKDLVIPNTVTSIKKYAFEGCSGLTSVTIGNSVTSIEGDAFEGCSGLTSVTIPNSVTSIGGAAFYGCSGLTSVTIPNSVTSIESYVFSRCSGLTSVTIPNSVTSIGDYAFSGCKGLTSVTIPNSVTSIGRWAFSSCSGLTSVTIPPSVTKIGDEAFRYCSGLTSVHISDIAAWCNIDFDGSYSNPLYYAHHLYLNGEEVKDLVIPNSVTNIGSYAFEGCDGLTSVTIGNSVTSIGFYAFYKCSGLTSVTIPNSVTSIRGSAFQYCSGLTSVTIPNSVTSIGERAFSGCPELLDVYCYAENVPSTNSTAFTPQLIKNATLHVPSASINSYKATAPWSGFGSIVSLPGQYSLTVSSVGYATLYLDFNAEIPEGVEAYIAKEVVDSRLKMERVEGVLPANTGVIILAEEGTYAFVESNETPAVIEKNLLKGTVEKTEITAEANTSYYVLAAPDGVVGMYLAKLTENKFWNNANKAYLPISYGDLGVFDEEVDSSVEQLSRKFVFDFGDETGITETEIGNVKSENSAIYDLSGRRVQKAQKGIFIQNGKVMIK